MVLDEICNASVYDTNPFYILGLPVDVSGREIRRKQEDMIDGCSLMGNKIWQNEFYRHLLATTTVPKVEMVKELFERLKDPEYIATEMFFWFWPQTEHTDKAIEAILNGERDKAVRLWQADMNRYGERGVVARHNLAVALLLYAIDGENHILNHFENIDHENLKMVDRYWKLAFDFWEGLSDDDSFWDVFAARVEKLNDPRLDCGFIETFKNRFPVCFDSINADFLVSYAQSERLSEAKRHFDYMVSTMSGDDDIEETMERAFKPMVKRVQLLIKRCEATKDPLKVIGTCRELLSGSSALISILKTIVPQGNNFTRGILNEIVTTVDGCLPTYSRKTGDYKPCLEMTKELLSIAATPLIVEKIRKSIKEWEDLIRQERERKIDMADMLRSGK